MLRTYRRRNEGKDRIQDQNVPFAWPVRWIHSAVSAAMNPTEDIGAILNAVSRLLAKAQSILFITGAGISADSGLPTYRGVGGLYNDEETEGGMSIEDVLSGVVFSLKPEITWRYLAKIEVHCRGALPNAAHRAIAELQDRIPKVVVLSQNVDGLHHQAGSRDVIEIHGSMKLLECTGCHFTESIKDLRGRLLPPRCPTCGRIMRPGVVLFGEELPIRVVQRLRQETIESFDMVFAIGTSGSFPYVTQPILSAKQRGIPTVEINPVSTPLSTIVDYHLPLGAAEAMQDLSLRLALLG